MKENNNELNKNVAKQVAGGGPPYAAGYALEDVKEMQEGLQRILAIAAAEDPGSPERTNTLTAALKLAESIRDVTKNMAQELRNHGERLKALEDSLGRI